MAAAIGRGATSQNAAITHPSVAASAASDEYLLTAAVANQTPQKTRPIRQSNAAKTARLVATPFPP